MLNIGLIGKIASVEKQVEKLKKYPDIKIQGKSSIGTKNQSSEYQFTIPEYNRIELIERSDAVVMEDSTLVPYSLIIDAIKRNKHIFFSGYPEFSRAQCEELVKLIEEAGTVVQVRNPLFFESQVQYLVKNTGKPFYLNVDIQQPYSNTERKVLWDVLLLISKMGHAKPKKIKTIHSGNKNSKFEFYNIRIEYSDSSVSDLNMTFAGDNNKILLKAISGNNYFNLNLQSHQISSITGSSVTLKGHDSIKEYESFFKSIIKKQAPLTGISDYFSVLKTMEEVEGKLNLASL